MAVLGLCCSFVRHLFTLCGISLVMLVPHEKLSTYVRTYCRYVCMYVRTYVINTYVFMDITARETLTLWLKSIEEKVYVRSCDCSFALITLLCHGPIVAYVE